MADYELYINIKGETGTVKSQEIMYAGIFKVPANNYHLIVEAISDVLHMRFDNRTVGGQDVHTCTGSEENGK